MEQEGHTYAFSIENKTALPPQFLGLFSLDQLILDWLVGFIVPKPDMLHKTKENDILYVPKELILNLYSEKKSGISLNPTLSPKFLGLFSLDQLIPDWLVGFIVPKPDMLHKTSHRC
ncbi:hypothetical protein CEXT_773431 [Caerostris extrusa]|uniref:Uncharacterized protein n=1 Tax=Caerostris extrusa TaxID=172846 RepID=A0AAV4PF19_CAEEX|nr:hypothetical protein CEXT_773431 [Caerostris extrusa]